jgi:hypothetical protein
VKNTEAEILEVKRDKEATDIKIKTAEDHLASVATFAQIKADTNSGNRKIAEQVCC